VQKNSGKLILIVDDSKDNQDLLKLVLVSKGYSVHCASNGQEALVMLFELSILPDLILLDAKMPVMDGYEFRVQQKKIGTNQRYSCCCHDR
jgi:two-component system response regulator VicR